jgi:hypothetical protein
VGVGIEKVRRMKYLGFWLERKGVVNWQVKERVSKSRRIVGRV